jgi:hypothetical protein
MGIIRATLATALIRLIPHILRVAGWLHRESLNLYAEAVFRAMEKQGIGTVVQL